MSEKWTSQIKPEHKWYNLGLKEMLAYKDLIALFVKRDFSTMYKQTILGPLWILINPFLTTVFFTVVFGRIANISTGEVPQFLFYMCANIFWGIFSRTLTKTSQLYLSNSHLLKKVYFPRLSLCVTTNITSIINFLIQFVMFLGFFFYFLYKKAPLNANIYILAVPLLILIASALASGCGLIITAVTTKYRDLAVLTSFGVQLWFYATPIVYPMSAVPESMYDLFMLNPMAPLIEGFRYAFLGTGSFPVKFILISAVTSLIILFIGLVMFARSEKTFSDTL